MGIQAFFTRSLAILSFLKHHLSKKEKYFAKWGFLHAAVALALGCLLAIWLVSTQFTADRARVAELREGASESAQTSDSLPPGTKIGGPFTLINQNGATVTDRDFAGKYLLIYFGYTNCPDMCPTGLQSMSRALDMLKTDAGKVALLFVTVDPARDTSQRLKEYDQSFSPAIVGLTGTPEQIASVAKEYQVYYRKGEGDEDYVVDHSSLIYLMDPSGKLVRTFDEEVAPQVIVDALQKTWKK